MNRIKIKAVKNVKHLAMEVTAKILEDHLLCFPIKDINQHSFFKLIKIVNIKTKKKLRKIKIQIRNYSKEEKLKMDSRKNIKRLVKYSLKNPTK